MSSVESPSIHATTPVAPVKTTPVVCEDCTPITLLTWKKPAKTGKIFGGIIVSLIVLKTVNLFNVFFHLAYIGLLRTYLCFESINFVASSGAS